MAYLYGLVICIQIFKFKGSQHFHRFYVIGFNFAKIYRNGPPLRLFKPITWPKRIGSRYGVTLWTCGMIMLLSA